MPMNRYGLCHKPAGWLLVALVLAACGAREPADTPSNTPAAQLPATNAPARAPATLAPTIPAAAAGPTQAGAPAATGRSTSAPATTVPAQATAAATRADLPTPVPPRPRPPQPVATPAGQWLRYQSQAGGYTASYPDGWSITEQAGAGGEVLTTFAAPGGATISVRVQPSVAEPGQPHDFPVNRRCTTVLVGAAAATRCGNTVTLLRAPADGSAATSVTISAAPGLDAATFEGFLQQFSLT